MSRTTFNQRPAGTTQLEAIEAANAVDIRRWTSIGQTHAQAIQSAMNEAFGSNGNGFVRIPKGTWTVNAGISYNITSHRTRHFGIICEGVIVSTINDANTDVIDIVCSSGANVRHLTIKGLCIVGGGAERHGLAVRCVNGGDGAIYAARLKDVSVESCGGSGIYILGDVFEVQIDNPICRGNNRGLQAENGAGSGSPVVSSIHVKGGNLSQNTLEGALITTPVNDVWFDDVDFINNGSYGLSSTNGLGGAIGCHFENNHGAAGSAAAGQGAIVCNNFFSAYGNTFKHSGASCKQTAAFRMSGGGTCCISGGNMEISGGAPAAELCYFSTSNGAVGWSTFVDGVKLTGGATYSTTHATGKGNFVVDGQPWPIDLTAGRTLTNTESGALFTNQGATGDVTLTLPASPFVGTTYTFFTRAVQNFIIDANTGQTIRIGGSASSSGGTATNNVNGAVLKIRAVSTTLWFAEYSTGTWTLA